MTGRARSEGKQLGTGLEVEGNFPVGFLRPRRQPLAGIAKTGRFFEPAGAQNLTDLGRFKTTAITYPIPETELGAVEAKDAGSQRPVPSGSRCVASACCCRKVRISASSCWMLQIRTRRRPRDAKSLSFSTFAILLIRPISGNPKPRISTSQLRSYRLRACAFRTKPVNYFRAA